MARSFGQCLKRMPGVTFRDYAVLAYMRKLRILAPSERSKQMTRTQDLREQINDLLNAKPETGEEWAEICLIEKLLVEAQQEEDCDNGQFGVGA